MDTQIRQLVSKQQMLVSKANNGKIPAEDFRKQVGILTRKMRSALDKEQAELDRETENGMFPKIDRYNCGDTELMY